MSLCYILSCVFIKNEENVYIKIIFLFLTMILVWSRKAIAESSRTRMSCREMECNITGSKNTTTDTNTWNVHRMFILIDIEYRNPETRKTLRLLSSGTKIFITFELKVIRHEERERERHNLSMLTAFPSESTCGTQKVNLLPPRQELNSLLFLNSQPTLPVHDVTYIPWSQFLSAIFILTSLNDISSPRAREHLR